MYHSYKESRESLLSGDLTCVELVNHFLKRIEEHKGLNVYLSVYAEEAQERAVEIDEKIKNGNAGKLAGLIVGLKDVICYKDHPLQSASKILDGFESQFNATAVQRLLDEDAIIIGRQNCDEFAMGSSNENSAFGDVLNAADNDRVPGGSSGGSAVAVQANLCHVSLGSDTGGSVRQPASFCGIVGLKPTYSRISRHGLVAFASSFDSIGILSQNIGDAALVLQTIAGADEFDSTVSTKDVPDYSNHLQYEKKVRIGYFPESIESEGVDEVIRKRMKSTIEKLEKEGHILEPVSFSFKEYVLPTYYVLTMAEASSNLSRFDGVKYGYRSAETQDLESMYKKTRSEGFGAEVKRRIMLGTFVLSAGYYDAYFTKAQKMRRLIQEETKSMLEQFEYVILPTAPTRAFKRGGHDEKDALSMYLEDLFTVQASLAGNPAISIPLDPDDSGLPIGLQVLSGAFEEQKLLAFSDYLMNLN